MLGPGGAIAPRRRGIVVPPRVDGGQIAVIVAASVGDYRSGDEIWCETLEPETMRTRSTATCSSRAPPAASCSAA